jgi:hypothetical protein
MCLAPVTRRDRTALISLGIPKLVRFHKIRCQCSMMVFLYLDRTGNGRAPVGMARK